MKIGYAMYSARELTTDPKGMRDTLKAISQMGYEGVEFFVYADTPADDLKAMLDEFGLEAIGTHVHKPRWDKDAQGEIEYAARAGIPYLVYPWIAPENRTEEFYSTLPGTLKELSGLCKEKGIRLQYHNHDFEYEPYQGGTVMEYLLAADQSYDFEVDTFWASYAGKNVPEYLKELGSRVPMIHIKDYLGVKDGRPQITAIGTGILNNAPIIEAARELGKEWLIVELDQTPLTVLESAKISIEYVKKILL